MNGFFRGIFLDVDGFPSFTRIAPAICLVLVVIIWVTGMLYKDMASYCQNVMDKLLTFAGLAWGVGKGGEQLKGIAQNYMVPKG